MEEQGNARHAYNDLISIVAAALLALLTAKYFWPLAAFDLPLGYDPGIYRYLFLKHAEGFPPFVIATLDPWAKEHSLGIFTFSTILLRLGIPVEWLIGWLWNLMPVALAATLAGLTAKRENREVGILVLFMALLSLAQYDGFASMYWKTYLSFLFCILAFHLLERRSVWFLVPGALAVACHHQTGVIFALSLVSWWLVSFRTMYRDPVWRFLSVAGVLMGLLGLLWYIPVWNEGFVHLLQSVLTMQGSTAPGGSFPPLSVYVRITPILLAFGLLGWFLSFRREKGSVWQFAVLWSAVFIVFRLVFYRRFFLQLDFFLLPFAARGLYDLWVEGKSQVVRIALCALVIIQSISTAYAIMPRWFPFCPFPSAHCAWYPPTQLPTTTIDVLDGIREVEALLPPNALVLSLEPQSAPWLRGWLLEQRVAGPGIFTSPWTYEQWEEVILGTTEKRAEFFHMLDGPAYFFVSPYFLEHYEESAKKFLTDPCLEKTDHMFLRHITCTSGA